MPTYLLGASAWDNCDKKRLGRLPPGLPETAHNFSAAKSPAKAA
jgi:hypothetical protein